jgi:hypothetical protein
MGPLLVFVWLTVNMYYWNMFGLLALGLAAGRRGLGLFLQLGLLGIFLFFYFYQHFNRGFSEGFAVAYLLAAGILLSALGELWASRKAMA